jgi:rare lipoprotein A
VARASFYKHPGRTASGETYKPSGLTAAHRTLPLGTRLRVVNQRNGRSVVVRINDRVPRTAKVPLDLSLGSAKAIGMTEVGIAPVALYQVP